MAVRNDLAVNLAVNLAVQNMAQPLGNNAEPPNISGQTERKNEKSLEEDGGEWTDF